MQFLNQLSRTYSLLRNPLKTLTRKYSQSSNKSIVLFESTRDTQPFIPSAILSVAGIVQFLFWVYLSHTCFTELRLTGTHLDKLRLLPKWFAEREDKNYPFAKLYLRLMLVFAFMSTGTFFLVLAFSHSLRLVHKLSYLEGSRTIKMITAKPFGGTREVTYPIEKLYTNYSCREAIHGNLNLPIGVKGSLLNFLIDKRGHFPAPGLFDSFLHRP